MAVTVEQESPLNGEVAGLVRQLNEYLSALTPDEFNYFMSVEEMNEPATTLFVARNEDGKAVGIGAMRREDAGIAEVKRMFTLPEVRGQGVGGKLLDAIIKLAQDEGVDKLVLETGNDHPEAWRLYESRGFSRCGPVLDYPDSEWSVFYEKPLRSSQAA